MRKYRQRSKRGNLLIETIVSLPILIAVLAVTLDAAFGVIAYLNLETTAVDAARAAASAPDSNSALALVNAVAQAHKGFAARPVGYVVNYENFDGDYSKGPFVTVHMQMEYTLPFPVYSVSKTIVFERLYSYPILNIKPANSQNT